MTDARTLSGKIYYQPLSTRTHCPLCSACHKNEAGTAFYFAARPQVQFFICTPCFYKYLDRAGAGRDRPGETWLGDWRRRKKRNPFVNRPPTRAGAAPLPVRAGSPLQTEKAGGGGQGGEKENATPPQGPSLTPNLSGVLSMRQPLTGTARAPRAVGELRPQSQGGAAAVWRSNRTGRPLR
jgi:hypothetical protein